MELTTERLILREFNEADWPAVLAYQTDPRYLCYCPWTERTPEAVQKFVQMFVVQQHEQPRAKFQAAIMLKSTRQMVGNCGLRLKAAGATEADLGYELAPSFWGQGYATEAVRALVQWGFMELQIHRVWACCIADNAGSARLLERLGLRLEGRLRESEYFKNRWWDMLVYSLFDFEWQTSPMKETGGRSEAITE